jgi:hypothetical protein
MKIDFKAILESAKEPLREIVIAIIPYLLVHFQAINTESAVIIYLILRGVDDYLHSKAPTGVAGGLVRF